jgi:cell wall-associated NlpC family hydrolase
LQPADVIFFGAKGPKSKPTEVDHMGIYLGNGWFVHSSRYGVALATLTGWYQQRFAWARRPLAEAGLVARS